MLFPSLARALAGSAAIAALNVAAQTATPAIPQATAPYRSAFEGYQAYSDDKLLDWKEANDTVGKIGGWRVYAREAQGAQPAPMTVPAGSSPPAAATPATPAVPAVPAPAGADPHTGHGKR